VGLIHSTKAPKHQRHGPCGGRLESWYACETLPSLVELRCPTLGSPLRHSPRAICTVLLDPRDPLLQSEKDAELCCESRLRKGEVFAYAGLPQNLKDLKDDYPWVAKSLYSLPGTKSSLSWRVVRLCDLLYRVENKRWVLFLG